MKAKHKDFEYEITWNDPSQGWEADSAGKFRVNTTVASLPYFDNYPQAVAAAKQAIDEFVQHVPQNKAEWCKAFEDCMVWTGYEDCHLNEDMVWSLLLKASKHLKA